MTDDDALNKLLAADGDEEPRPGFDTRFRARLAEMKTKKTRRAWALGLVSALGAAAAIAIAVVPRAEQQHDPALEIAMEYELLENYDIVKDLPAIEVLAQLEEQP
jgi:hypothetical protein